MTTTVPSTLISGQLGGLIPIGTGVNANNSSYVEISGMDATYDQYLVTFSKVLPSQSDVDLYLRVTVGGVEQSGASAYYRNHNTATRASYTSMTGHQSSGYLLNSGASWGGYNGQMIVYNPADAGVMTQFFGTASWKPSTQDVILSSNTGVGTIIEASAVDGLTFRMSSGDIASGTFRLYGIVNT